MGHERLTLFTVGAGETVHPGSSHFTEEEELFNQKIESISKLKKEKICSIWDSWPSISGETALTYNHGCSIREMMRESPEKIASLKDGSIRPFLLLVSMHPRRRAFLAFQVGLDLFKRASYGDSHKEARYIITASRTGIQGRTNEAWSETINPLGHNSNWYDSCYRASKRVTKHYREIDNGPSLRREVKAKKKPYDISLPGCQEVSSGYSATGDYLLRSWFKDVLTIPVQPNNSYMHEMEEALLLSVLRMAGLYQPLESMKKMNESEKVYLQTTEYKLVEDRLCKSGWKDKALIRMAALDTVMPGYALRLYYREICDFLYSRKDKTFRRKEVISVIIPVCTITIGLVLGITIIIGSLFLGRAIFSIYFRKETGTLLPLVVALNFQRMWLNIGGVRIDDYYPKSKAITKR